MTTPTSTERTLLQQCHGYIQLIAHGTPPGVSASHCAKAAALLQSIDVALAAATQPSASPPWGFVIEHADGNRWRTMDSLGMPEWTDDISKALRVALREHADAYAADDPEDVRIRPASPAASASGTGESAALSDAQIRAAMDLAEDMAIESVASAREGKFGKAESRGKLRQFLTNARATTATPAGNSEQLQAQEDPRIANPSIRGELFGIGFEPGGSNGLAVLSIEDDGNYYEKDQFDVYWLADLANVVAKALAASQTGLDKPLPTPKAEGEKP